MTQTAEEILDKYYQLKMHWKTVNRAEVLKAMLEYSSQFKEDKPGEWQLCPKCNGGGRAMNMDNPIPMTIDVCDVCNGNKIIARPKLVNG